MTTTLKKETGAPVLNYRGHTVQFDLDTREATVDDDELARELADVHSEVVIVDHAPDPPTLETAEDSYDAARRLAKHHDVSAGGTHEDILDRIRAHVGADQTTPPPDEEEED